MTSLGNKIDEILGFVKTTKVFLEEKETQLMKKPKVLRVDDEAALFAFWCFTCCISSFGLFMIYIGDNSVFGKVCFAGLSLMVAASILGVFHILYGNLKDKILLKNWFKKGLQQGLCQDFLNKLVLEKIDVPFTLQERVDIIEKIEQTGASPEQVAQLYVLAQDQELPLAWWNVLRELALEERDQLTKRLHFEEQERLAQEKIQEFVEKQVSVEVAVLEDGQEDAYMQKQIGKI